MKFSIVGAGPVGLWVATQLKKREPKAEVVVFERHKLGNYVRSHALNVEWMSPRLYAKRNHTKDESLVLDRITGTVSTKTIEAELLGHAQSLGVKIEPENELSLEAAEQIGKTGYFIAADGAHSKIRRALLGPDDIEKQVMQNVIEVKLWCPTDAKKIAWYKGDHYTAIETVGKNEGEGTPITVRYFVDQATYDAVPEATFKNPINEDALPWRTTRKLKEDIGAYLSHRWSDDKLPYGSEAITKLQLSTYAARKFALCHNQHCWFLAGDAAMGLPYFRSLNAGFLIGSQLAGILTNPLLDDEGKIIAYNAIRIPDKMTEYAIAGVKNLALNAYDAIRKIL